MDKINKNILCFDSAGWDGAVADLLIGAIREVINQKSTCNFIVTGGNTANSIYKKMHKIFTKEGFPRLNIFFSDERCVPVGLDQTNYEMFVNSFFGNDIPNNVTINRVRGESLNIKNEAIRYGGKIEDIDLMLLTLGDDGHIASLFKIDEYVCSLHDSCMPVMREIPFISRVSITPALISSVNKTYVLAKGTQKFRLLDNHLRGIRKIESINLLSNAVWIIDRKIVKNAQ